MTKDELLLHFEEKRKKRELEREERDLREKDLIDGLKDDVNDSPSRLKTALTPIQRTKNFLADTPKWKELVSTYKKAKNLNHRLLSVMLASVFYEYKPAFLFSQKIMKDLLENNIFIDRKTIGWSEYAAFIVFLLKNSYVKIEIDPQNNKDARMFSLDHRLLEAFDIYAYDKTENEIKRIVEDYKKTESLKAKRAVVSKKSCEQSIGESTEAAPVNTNQEDLQIVNKVLALSHKFGDFENKNFYQIADLVKKFGSFKGDQKKLFVNFIKDKTWKT